MTIYSVLDPEFKPYGKVLEGYDTEELMKAMEAISLPEEGTAYRPGIESLEACSIFKELQDRQYGGMPIQLGMCWGRNTKLNCLEYHRDSEINIGDGAFILRSSLAPTDLLPELALDDGYIRVDRAMATSIPGVFAAGDCTGKPLQVAKAVGEGHVAGLSACEYLEQQ